MSAGRPTDYDDEIIESTKEYLETYKEQGDVIPSVAGLAVHLQIARSTIYDWASQEEKKEFSDILNNILSTQERVLMNKGLTSEFNSNIVKLALGKHGYTDKSDFTSGGKPIPILNGLSNHNSNREDSEAKKED